MILEELRYHSWEPISVHLDSETVSRYSAENDSKEVPAEVLLNLECGRIINTLLNYSEQVFLASSSLDIRQFLPIGTTVTISTSIHDLRCLKEQAFVTIKQEYSWNDRPVAELTQVMVLKS